MSGLSITTIPALLSPTPLLCPPLARALRAVLS
eukprot:CAMPEP_0173412210 /NCGR_PEP_ID=MMETSP1356-20130122/78951_1 /TAXON_ID=77927 ORGANISM="Hemiselmis virescens, Strain PCC157" /NCGR_SAMPLE_ID=MMETSP1356 /ASSEMBLY_ACC=CAM_ASM_000847 /LENGTH=32 /DNA_ID= /DNA_START= /DNA_END= /DNA_ORIENTATION=